MRYKTLEFETPCTCGECDEEDTITILVVDETLTFKELTGDHDPSRVVCEAFSREAADQIVRALNGPTLN